MNTLWNGFPAKEFRFEDKNAMLVFPRERTACRGLALKTEYRDAFPEAIELSLLEKGFHLCFLQNENRWGTDTDLDRKARFVRKVAEDYQLSPRVIPVGMSCGGLIAILFAARYPELVSCLYLDAPVINYMSCPCGFGVGDALGDGSGIPEILEALHMQSISQLLGYRNMPLDRLPELISHRIPAALVAGGEDHTVPFCENGMLLQQAYEKAGVELLVRIKPHCDHHPHGLTDNREVLQFLLDHCGA